MVCARRLASVEIMHEQAARLGGPGQWAVLQRNLVEGHEKKGADWRPKGERGKEDQW